MIYCANEAYKRLLSLQRIAFSRRYRTDIQSDGVGSFIIKGEHIIANEFPPKLTLASYLFIEKNSTAAAMKSGMNTQVMSENNGPVNSPY